ncbi:hypothetical protein PF010_g25364 [Phytophthora fragariae]|uniref:Uncharacterized protein n=1 Tax=Phytophthora fragariae TaxID=53985 RepID=A0A6G0K0T9_9STRA|nr:hypothetical protein PF010_g25364 [Phytophthora fragariae]
MADFSDNEDRLLYRLAKAQVDAGHKISWRRVRLDMPFCGKTQRQLQIRLKTLKRTRAGLGLVFAPICDFSSLFTKLSTAYDLPGNTCAVLGFILAAISAAPVVSKPLQ